MATRARISRKALHRPDEFQTIASQVLAWGQGHRAIVLGATAGLLGAAAVALGLARAQSTRAEAAAIAFSSAQGSLASDNLDAAAAGFLRVAEQYPSTPFGHLAHLLRAHTLVRQAKWDEATAAYQEYLATSPTDHLRQEALNGVGHAKEGSGDLAGARDAYHQAAELDGPYRRDSLLGEARAHEATGDAQGAAAIYQRMLGEAPDIELRSFLLGKLPPGADLAPVPALQ